MRRAANVIEDKFRDQIIKKSSANAFLEKLVSAGVPEKLLENLRTERHAHKYVHLVSAQMVFNLALHEDFARLVMTPDNKEHFLTLLLVILKKPAHPQIAAILLEILLGRIILSHQGLRQALSDQRALHRARSGPAGLPVQKGFGYIVRGWNISP